MLYLKRQYEPAVDGLRALAVLSVLLFHAAIPGFSGGFVGVDIFFVISGYLITRNILGDLEDGSFSFKAFYVRRIRRIFPAMFFTMALVFVVGAFVFFSTHMERLGESVLFSALGLSNVFFWKEAGYWDVSKDFKPLLHFWSLAVEEQFYLFWPAFLYGMVKLYKVVRDRAHLIAMAVLFVVSLVLSQIFLNVDDTAAFYLMPFRIFEFCIGAFVLWFDPRKLSAPFVGRGWAAVLLGLVCVCVPVFVYTEASAFPGVLAVLPCLGAALLIAARHSGAGELLLGNRMMTGIGKVSYSLYLIHWPILVFYQYVTQDTPSLIEVSALLAASFVASYFMYRFIEQPFRKKWDAPNAMKPSRVFAVAGVLLLLIAIPAAHARMYDGWTWREENRERTLQFSSEDVKLIREQRTAWETERVESKFFEKHPSDFVILGDSYSYDVMSALEHNGVKSPIQSLRVRGGCVPLLGQPSPGMHPKVKTEKYLRECEAAIRELIASDEVKNAKVIMIGAHWYPYSLGWFVPTVEAIRKISDAPIIIFGNKMIYKGDVPTRASAWGKAEGLEDYINSGMDKEGGLALDQAMRDEVAQVANQNVIYVDIIEILCPNAYCPILTDDFKLHIFDDAHWSVEGAAHFGKKFKESDNPAVLLLFDE